MIADAGGRHTAIGKDGFLKLGNVALGGTKVKANASRHSALSHRHALKLKELLQAEASSRVTTRSSPAPSRWGRCPRSRSRRWCSGSTPARGARALYALRKKIPYYSLSARPYPGAMTHAFTPTIDHAKSDRLIDKAGAPAYDVDTCRYIG